MDCFLKQISDKIEFTLIMNPDKDFFKKDVFLTSFCIQLCLPNNNAFKTLIKSND